MSLSASAILAATDLPIQSIEVPEWGGKLHYRAISLEELGRWEDGLSGDGKEFKPDQMMAQLLVLSLCDEGGKPLFQQSDWKKLAGKNAVVTKRVYEAVCAANGIGEQGRKVARGNFESPASASA